MKRYKYSGAQVVAAWALGAVYAIPVWIPLLLDQPRTALFVGLVNCSAHAALLTMRMNAEYKRERSE